MHVLVVDSDPIRIGFLAALLSDAGVACQAPDEHISALEHHAPYRAHFVHHNILKLEQEIRSDDSIRTDIALEGGIGAVPRRLAVRQADADRALRLLREAGEA